MLLYASEMDRLIYLYYYRNQFISIDTNLNVAYTGKTIDTVSVAKIQLDTVYAENMLTFSAPPLIVNKRACVFKDKLFVNSNLMADNEDPKLFNQHSVIDIYDLSKNGEYKFSFYIPAFKKNKMQDFKIYDKTLVVIYDHYLVTYYLNF